VAATPRARLGSPVHLQGHDCLSGCRLCEVGSQAIDLVVNRSCGKSRILQSYKKKQIQVAGNRTLRMDRLSLTSDLIDNEMTGP
jgi:hypothetical protein